MNSADDIFHYEEQGFLSDVHDMDEPDFIETCDENGYSDSEEDSEADI